VISQNECRLARISRPSAPARHDVARRVDCGMLAQRVTEHRLEDWEAAELALDLAYHLAKRAYRL
jgi:glucuronate isomerase